MLIKLGLRPKCIFDIDILRSPELLEALTEHSPDRDEILKSARIISQEVEKKKPNMNVGGLRSELSIELGKTSDSCDVTRDLSSALKRIIESSTAWSAVKSTGEAAIPFGEAQKRWRIVKDQLSQENCWVVPVGELEGFLRTGGRKGAIWLNAALSKDIANDEELSEARRFVRGVFNFAE